MIADAIAVEKKRVPTVTVITDLFKLQAAQVALGSGLVALPVVVLEHPIGGQAIEVVSERTEGILKKILEALTLSVEEVKEKYGVNKYMASHIRLGRVVTEDY